MTFVAIILFSLAASLLALKVIGGVETFASKKTKITLLEFLTWLAYVFVTLIIMIIILTGEFTLY